MCLSFLLENIRNLLDSPAGDTVGLSHTTKEQQHSSIYSVAVWINGVSKTQLFFLYLYTSTFKVLLQYQTSAETVINASVSSTDILKLNLF